MVAVKDTEILSFSEKKTVMAAVKDTEILSFSEQKTVIPDTDLSQQRPTAWGAAILQLCKAPSNKEHDRVL